jgi:hypothetical protein
MMALDDLQSVLNHLDVRLSAAGGKLSVDAPAGALTSEIKDALKQHKDDLLAQLSDRTDVRRSWLPRPPELAEWPVERRQQWGELANELEDANIPWPEHERQAYEQIRAEVGVTSRPNDRADYRAAEPGHYPRLTISSAESVH